MKTSNNLLAKNLRHNLTSTEKELWRKLRNRKLAGAKFRRQQCFGPYILDFYCAEKKLNVEIDGGQHDEAGNRVNDQRRADFILAEGIRTIRFWNSQVRENLDWVLQKIKMELVK